ncbi:MAG: 4-hydroxythreonine-4-phosphate dehydrogenase PdxA [Thaumarchaeota archaeon]|nr:4-hydroxythreonine-4-phosphate dehydrogenase PdxA [Nitrososphaerota archaeon]
MIGVTLGDPAGVGPEIVAKSLGSLAKGELILIGNRENFVRVISDLRLDVNPDDYEFVDIKGGDVQHGRVQKAAGEIAVKSIEKAVKLAQANRIESMATAPINKEAILMAGSKYIDHTTMLSGLTGSKANHTVFEVGALRIFFMTKHVSLAEACSQMTESLVYASILEADDCLRLLGVRRRRIAVAGLNPHSGEGGLFGREEIDQISPAINRAKKNLDVSGPYPADSVFHRAAEGAFDMVIALYHDQGHIAAKMLDFHRTVSLNLGLPFLRTSVDHGTAFDIAGKGLANPLSMVEAVKKAAEYGKSYRSRYREIM